MAAPFIASATDGFFVIRFFLSLAIAPAGTAAGIVGTPPEHPDPGMLP